MSTAIEKSPEVTEAVDTVAQNVALARKEAEALEVQTPEQAETAAGFLKDFKQKRKAAEDARKEITGPLNASLKAVNALFKEVTEPLDVADKIVREKVGEYQAEQHRLAEIERQKAEEARREQERLAAEERARAEEAAAKARAAAEAEQNEKARAAAEAAAAEAEEKAREQRKAEASMQAQVVKAPEAQKLAGVSTRKTWKFEIEKPYQVPREYLKVNEQAIRSAVADGVREIPGVRIFQEESVVVR